MDSSLTRVTPKARRTLLKGSRSSTGSWKGKGKSMSMASQDSDEEMQEVEGHGEFLKESETGSDSDSVVVVSGPMKSETSLKGISQKVHIGTPQEGSSTFGKTSESQSQSECPRFKKPPLIQKGVIHTKDKSVKN